MRIAVDVGFGYTKAVSEENKRVIFPSVVGTCYRSSLSDSFAKNEEDYEIMLFPGDKDENAYYVGEAAIGLGGTRTWEDQASSNRNLLPLIATALFELVEGDESIDLAVGLPMGYYDRQKGALKQVLEGKIIAIEIRGMLKQLTIKSVFVFPQGAGSYYAAIYDLHGQVINGDLINKPIGVINIGFRTTDYLFMGITRKGIRVNPNLTGSLDEGMNFVHRNLQTLVSRKTGREPGLNKIEQALRWQNGDLRQGANVIPLKAYEKKSQEELAQTIASQLKIKWGDDMNDLATILIGGGGGDDLYPFIQNHFLETKKIGEANYSDALGFLAAQAQAMRIQNKRMG